MGQAVTDTPEPPPARNEPIGTLHIPRMGIDWVSANSRVHWAKKASQVKDWHTRTWICAYQQRFPKGMPFCYVEPTFMFSTKRHRDPGNFVLTTKAIIDTLCEWGSWEGDDPRYLREMMPLFEVLPGEPDGVMLRCYAQSPTPNTLPIDLS